MGPLMKAVLAHEMTSTTTQAYVASSCWLYVATDRGARLTFVWGAPELADAVTLTRLWKLEIEGPKHDALFDASGLEYLPLEVAQRVHAAQQKYGGQSDGRIGRQALVFPPNLIGAIVAGYSKTFSVPREVQVYESRRDALAWLGLSALDDQLAALLASASRSEHLQNALRRFLATGEELTLTRFAATVGMSPRALQRQMQTAGTSFVQLLANARVAHAKRLLLETDEKVEVIARTLRLANASALSRLFKRIVGARPHEWRAEAKLGPPDRR